MDDMTAFERQLTGEIAGLMGPIRPVDDLAVFEAVTAANRSHGWGFTMFSALKFIAAGVIVALFGGFLLAGLLTSPQGDEMAPAAVTESPSPMTSEELLSGMVTEEVEPGVYRVANDGVRDLSPDGYRRVFAGQDGSIWLDPSAYSSRLGVGETHEGQLEEWDNHSDFKVTHDGTVWTFGYLDADGSTWQTIETPTILEEGEFAEHVRYRGFIATESDVWAPHYGGVWHYADGAWEHITYGDPDAGALPDDVFWGWGAVDDTNSDDLLYRHDGTGWQQWSLREYDMQPGGWVAGAHVVAPDGSFWAGWKIRDREEPQAPSRCEGVNRFDGRTWVRYLSGMCVPRLGMDIAPDGSVWVLAWEGGDREDRYAGSGHLYVITPEAVAATE